MLKQRVITALVLIAFLLPALFAPMAWPFAVLSLLLIAAAGWEWGRLNGASTMAVPMGVLLAAACAAALWAGWGEAPPRTVCVNFILSVFCLVWAADIAAYFGGKALGRRKLAPGISPGKSWEGVWSGMLGAVALAAFWLWLDTAFKMDSASLYTRLYGRFGAIGLVGIVVFLAAMSVVGDLFESLVKRAAGAKDSSKLLPGHGGVLDRVDALLPVFPIAMALITL